MSALFNKIIKIKKKKNANPWETQCYPLNCEPLNPISFGVQVLFSGDNQLTTDVVNPIAKPRW